MRSGVFITKGGTRRTSVVEHRVVESGSASGSEPVGGGGNGIGGRVGSGAST